MAAKLEWVRRDLVLVRGDDRRNVAEVRRAVGGPGFRYEIHRGLVVHVSDPHEKIDDARQDCEAEVRRLLKEAGVEVDP